MQSHNRGVGRPRLFDVDRALDRAVERFGSNGFDGTSVRDLAADLGISQSSLYAAFGRKEQIFSRALDRYEDQVGLLDMRALAQAPSLKDGIGQFSLVTIKRITKKGERPGCMVLSGNVASSTDNEAVVEDLRFRRRRHARVICLGLRAHISSANAEAIGRYVAAALIGLAIQASDGQSRAELKAVVPFIVAGALIRANH